MASGFGAETWGIGPGSFTVALNKLIFANPFRRLRRPAGEANDSVTVLPFLCKSAENWVRARDPVGGGNGNRGCHSAMGASGIDQATLGDHPRVLHLLGD
jgi:hypothetical protein